jgi:hypothetical protein
MALIVILPVTAWLLLAAVLSSFMARRGYDHFAWLTVCVLFGPVATVFAVFELVWAIPRRPEVVDRGQPGGGDVDVLVIDAGSNLGVARWILGALDGRVHRLALARVLPFDGPRDMERTAAEQLRATARSLDYRHPELLLLFGAPSDAVARHIGDSCYDVVVADSLAEWAERLTGTRTPLVTTAADLDEARRVGSVLQERASHVG